MKEHPRKKKERERYTVPGNSLEQVNKTKTYLDTQQCGFL